MTNIGHTAPNSIEAEEYLLSCCLLDGADVVSRCLEAGIRPDSFYLAAHGIIFERLLDLYDRKKPMDVSVVAEELKASRQLDEIGGYAFLTQVSSRIPTTAQAGFFIERVVELATLRDLIRRGTAIVEGCYTWDGDDVAALVEKAAASIMSVNTERANVGTWREAIAAGNKRIDRQLSDTPEKDDDLIPFGLPDLDRVFQPMQSGQLVVLAARPSVGKSSLARQIAYSNATRFENMVVFASLEVMGPSLALNLAQTLSGISVRTVKRGAHPKDIADFRGVLNTLEMPTLDVMASSNIRMSAIRARARLLRARGRPIRLLVVDYLQLMPDGESAKGENRATAVGRVSRALKRFAIDEDCAVLALSQLNRESARDGREPALHDLRESGDIEQDADKVIFLHRPGENPMTGKAQPENSLPSEVPSFFVNAIQAKGRDDGTGIVSLNFKRAITRFEQISRAT